MKRKIFEAYFLNAYLLLLAVRSVKITPYITIQRIGCFKDTSRRAITPVLEGRLPIVKGNYQRRKKAIARCALAAARYGYNGFAVQHGGQCFAGPRALRTYAKYGRSNRCRNGKGGPWANDVYRISGKCRLRTTTGYCCVPFTYHRRRYNGCATNRRGQKWCAIAPDFHKNKMWGYCRGGGRRKLVCLSVCLSVCLPTFQSICHSRCLCTSLFCLSV
ncbi:uncharacterized protein LOC110068604 [Orbicella faveolata]|uniref:uncharacterized protein LOC110068604 n=1 Tax=Orbicella faveolata TaxID=48498 RepID=UPI0009E2AEDE|nr:uncharacterized protein LOC110068604 [Orbicella faveolata]